MTSLVRFETYERQTLVGKRYFFRIVRERNNEILAPSQPYKGEEARDFALDLIMRESGKARIVKGKRK